MIQRIQTVYLFFIALMAGLTLGLPLASLINVKANMIYTLDIRGISLIQPTGQTVLQSTTSLLTAFPAVFGVIALFVLFSYKNRVKQIRLSVINFIFMIGFYILYAFYIWMGCNDFSAEVHVKVGAIFPLIAMIFNYLAIGAIGKDEKLVKSLDRLR